MQEETKSILYQRTQNGWSKKSIYTLKLLPNHMKQITKCHALQVYVVVENSENLDGWYLCVCVYTVVVSDRSISRPNLVQHHIL